MISFDFGKTTAKMTFLQWNHVIIPLQKKAERVTPHPPHLSYLPFP